MIEINRAQSPWIYRISPDDPLTVQRRRNKSGAHWYFWLRRPTADEALRALLEITKSDDDKEPETP